LWLSALFAGFSLGIKHTAALWIFLVGILYLVETIRSRESIRKVLLYGVLYTFLALAVASPWYIKNAIWFHNPIYPFVTGEVAEFGPNGVRYFNAEDERKLDAHFEAARKAIPDVVAAQQQELRRATNARLERHPMRLWEFFFKPKTYLMAEPYHFPNYLFLIIPLIVFLRPGKWIWWLLILGLAFVFSVTATDLTQTLEGDFTSTVTNPFNTTVDHRLQFFTDAIIQFRAADVPEPSEMVLMLLGMGAVGAMAWRRRGTAKMPCGPVRKAASHMRRPQARVTIDFWRLP